MNKMSFEVRRKNGAWVQARLGATNHSEEPHMSTAELAIGGALFLFASGFVFLLLLA
jgi:hypothetical protein